MANKDAGNSIQRAIEAGEIKKCSAMKKDGTPCNHPARAGYDVCHVHGAGTRKREIEGVRRPPGRPSSAIYVNNLSDSEKETFASVFGDLSLVNEVGMLKSKLSTFLSMVNFEECEDTEDDDKETKGRKRREREKILDRLYAMTKMIDTLTKLTTAAHEQLMGKKITVTINREETDVMDRAREIAITEVSRITGLLCNDCKRRIIEDLAEKQSTIIDNG